MKAKMNDRALYELNVNTEIGYIRGQLAIIEELGYHAKCDRCIRASLERIRALCLGKEEKP